MSRFVIAHRRALVQFGLALFVISAGLVVCGCAAPTWLTDIGNLLPIIGTAFSGLLSVITGYLGSSTLAATISKWIQEVITGVGDVQTLVKQYQESPNPTLLTDIEAGLADVETNIQTDFSNLGLPPVILAVIAQVADVALATLQSIGSLIPVASAKAGDKVSFTRPMDQNELKSAIKAIFGNPTGDPKLDALMLKVKV